MAGTIQSSVNAALSKIEQGTRHIAGMPTTQEQEFAMRRQNLSVHKLELAEARVKERQEMLKKQQEIGKKLYVGGHEIYSNTPAYDLIMKQLKENKNV